MTPFCLVKHVSFKGVLVFWKMTGYFLNFPVFVCYYKSWSTKNTFQSKKNLAWFPEKCFPFILGGKQFLEVVKNLEMSYYLLIISNLVLKLLIAIYILFWIFFFSISSLRINFYINFDPHFYNCYLLFPYYFLIEIFYLSNIWPSLFWLLLILFEIIYEMVIIIILISSSFYFFLFFRFDLYYFHYYLFYLR
jgi:hypothetical protein